MADQIQQIQAQIEQLVKEREEARAKMNQADGAIQALVWLLSTLEQPPVPEVAGKGDG